MEDNPVLTHDYMTPKAVNLRDEDTTKFLGNGRMIVKGFKNEKDRVQEAMDRNQVLMYGETVAQLHQYRERHPDKEIQPDMHFHESSNVLRLLHEFERSIPNAVTEKDRNRLKNIETLLKQYKRNHSLQTIRNDHNQLPNVKPKTHFKAAVSLSMNIPDSLNDYRVAKVNDDKSKFLGDASMDDLGLKDTKTNRDTQSKGDNVGSLPDLRPRGSVLANLNPPDAKDDVDAVDKISETKKDNKIDIFNPREVSKHILVKCNVVRDRNPKVPVLHSGDGKLMNMSTTNIREMYSKIFH
eukprot:TRINITY_DN7551_c0_g1_i10.p1 TRINITY_DN7551_c0_g1~~TRINITY_DN7551_c0_g1_i10.p1  ORF type:complete len:296 (-),score=17.88 TRINITY_DN7551_c0_g1_i10:184-1071(-)